MKVPEFAENFKEYANKKLSISYFPENEKNISYAFVEPSEAQNRQNTYFRKSRKVAENFGE